MSDLIRRSDLRIYTSATEEQIALIPAVDAVEVVRCASCRFADYVPGPMEYLCRRNGIAVKGDEFCSRGQRREGGDA